MKKVAIVFAVLFVWLNVWPIVSEYGLGEGIGVFAFLGLGCVLAPVLTAWAVWAVIRRGR